MKSPETISRLIGGIYDAAADSSLWQTTLCDVIRATDARAGHLLMIEPRGSRQNLVSANFDHGERLKYNSYYGKYDPVAPFLETTPIGQIVPCRDTVSPREKESEFYRDWASPNEVGDGLFFNVERRGKAICTVVLARPWLSKPLAAPHTVHLLELLIPHFQRAMAARRALAGVTLSDGNVPELIETQHGCVLFGTDGRVLYATAAARQMTLQGEGLVLTRDGLHARAPNVDALLQGLIATARPDRNGGARSGGRMTITRAGRQPVTVHALPLSSHWLSQAFPGSTLVLIVDGERVARLGRKSLQDLYGLTPAEAALAVRIPGSRSLQTLAKELGLSLSTVRTHLQRVFEKTGTHRQAELVKLLSELSLIGDGIGLPRERRQTA